MTILTERFEIGGRIDYQLFLKHFHENIEVSDGNFPKPENISTILDCEEFEENNTNNGDEDVPEELDF